ncbi:hypothetical protein CMV30_10050 [Nibricoccus aquaticus]|uniref:Uncharacterized protein n=1 Tax=Nibricoccus aquaticus TaxID=2576891 RepID=A0A290QAP7_9BACT|nr:hypothetical protein [Nibricoccus aquaticus]ATC64270.1 hypothetical protein CMV30_10050 [Nibricoccus aquaticus]
MPLLALPEHAEPKTFSFRQQPRPPSHLAPPRRATAGWLHLLAWCWLFAIGQTGFSQTMTLSAPSTGGSAIDNMAVVFSISGEAGGINSVRLVMTYVSGYSTASIGSTWTMTMFSVSASQSFSFNPSTATSNALFRAVTQLNTEGKAVTQINASGVAVTPNPPDGVYSVYAQYTRTTTGVIVRSNTASNVTVDTGALPPTFSYTPVSFTVDPATDVVSLPAGTSPVIINPATDVLTLKNHGLAPDAAVTLSGTNLPSATTYYVSSIDTDSFKLATSSGGSTYADITPGTSGTITYSPDSAPVAINPATDVITLTNHGLAANTEVTLSGTNLPSTTTYYVSSIDTDSFKLATTSGGSTYADITPGTIGTINVPCHLLTAGAAVKISGTNLLPDTTYYASPIDASSLKLATTPGGSTYADFPTGTTGTIRALSAPTTIAIDATTDVITLAGHGYAANAEVSISGTNLTSNTPYYVSVIDTDSFKLATTSGGSTFADFTPGVTGSISSLSGPVAIDPATDVITFTSHGLAANTLVNITGTNLLSTTAYYVSVVNANSFKLATTSGGSTFADIASGTIRSLSAATDVTIAPATDVITFANHGLAANTAVTISGTNLLPSTTYYVGTVTTNSFKLATTSGGSTYADITPGPTSATVTSTEALKGDVLTLGTNLATFYYSIPENYAATTAKITFTGRTTVVVTMPNLIRNNSLVFDRSKIPSVGIISTTSPSLPDDTYTVSFAFRDANNHTATGVTLPYMAYDAGTLAPSITNLVNNAAIVDGSAIAYTLPETPYGGTVKLTFSNGTTTTVIPLANAKSGTFTYDRALHASSIPTGTYTVTLSYQDTAGNSVTSTTLTGVSVTVTPLSATTDTDGDGLNDLAELNLAALGFDWQVAQPALVTAFLNNASLFTLTEYDTNRTTGRTDVTSSPATYNLFTSAQVTAQYDAGRLVGRSDVTGAPNTYDLFTATQVQTQVDASRLLGRSDVTGSPATYDLFTSAQVTAQYDAGRLVGRSDVTGAPATYSLFTSAQIAASRTAGQTDVTTNPIAYALYRSTDLQTLTAGAPVITRDSVTGKWKLTMAVEKSTDLTHFTPLPFTVGTTSINASGELELEFTVADPAAFFRLQVR